MRISLVIPNYNSGPLLERALRSVLDQNYPDLQIIMADAESTDESSRIIERYRDRFDPLIRRKDGGQADGLNGGFARASGEIHGWLCADDELLPGALHHVAAEFRAHPETGVLTGACERIYPDGSVYLSPPDPRAWSTIGIKDTIEQPSTFWRADLHRRAGPLDTRYYLAFDWDLWCRLRAAGGVFRTTERALSRYHFSATNKSGSSGEQHVKEGFRVIRRYGPWGGGLSYLYRFLYYHFDLRGCYDNPPTCSRARAAAFAAAMHAGKLLLGERLLYLYNWHFASCQQRNLKWW